MKRKIFFCHPEGDCGTPLRWSGEKVGKELPQAVSEREAVPRLLGQKEQRECQWKTSSQTLNTN